jgi:hypothetical protein
MDLPETGNTEYRSRNVDLYQRGDVFFLGCFFHYVLTKGKHPFGDTNSIRERNINDPNHFVYRNDWNPNIFGENDDRRAVTLLKDMIKFNLNDICALDKIFGSRYFLPHNFYKLYGLPGVKPGLCVIFNQEKFENVNFLLIYNLFE